MGLAESSESTIYVGKTTTKGVEPTTYETYTPRSHSLSASAGSFQSEDIDPSGKGLDTFRTNIAGAGDIGAHWRPSIFDSAVECALRGPFGAAFNQTLTISFGAPSSGLQVLTDDGAGGVLGGLTAGDIILVSGLVADPANAGLRRVVSSTTDTVTVYNPGGSLSAADAGVDIDHNGVATLGVTAAWLWAERLHSDGTNLIYSEFFKDQVVESLNLLFPASGPSGFTLRMQGDAPTLVHAEGSPPVTKQRGGSDNGASSARLVHGMDDVREIVLYSPTEGIVVLHDLVTRIDMTVQRQIRQDSAVGGANIINVATSRPTLQINLDAFVNDVANGTTQLAQFLLDNPDDMTMHVIFGATDATAYGMTYTTVRVLQAPSPVGGNNAAGLINAQLTATDVRVTRIP